jgi:hypothetical protein
MKDLYNHIVPVQIVAPVKVVDNTVPAAVEVDLAGFNSAVIEVNCGAKAAGDTGTITLKLEHADDSAVPGVAGTYAEVEAVDMQGVTPAAGTGIILTLATGAVAAAIHKLGYIGGKRHLKFTVAENDGNATGTMMAISLIKGHGLDVPAIS